MRRSAIWVLVVAMCAGPLPGQADFTRGDANSDCRIDLSDALFTLQRLFLGGRAHLCDDAADSNDSGTVDVSDAVFVLNYLFLGGPQPPSPFPVPGPDSTDDALGCRVTSFALSFDGEDDFVSIPSSPTLRFDGGVSIACWIYLKDERTRHHILTKWNGWDENLILEIKRQSIATRPHIKLYVAPMPGGGLVGEAVIPVGQWIHVACTVDAAVARIYLNGELDGTMSMVEWPMVTAGSWIRIGGMDTTPPEPVFGMIEELSIFTRALAQDEIRDHMGHRLTCNEPGLAAYYPCDEGAGATLLDASCNNNHGQLGHFVDLDTADPVWVPGIVIADAP